MREIPELMSGIWSCSCVLNQSLIQKVQHEDEAAL